MVDAARVSGLADEIQDAIAVAIQEGKNPKDVLREFLPQSTNNHRTPNCILTTLVRAIEEALGAPSLAGGELPRGAARERYSALFKSGRELLAKLERWNKLEIKRAAPRDEEMYQIIQRQARRSSGEVE